MSPFWKIRTDHILLTTRKTTIEDTLWLTSLISNFLPLSKFLRFPWGEKIGEFGWEGENYRAGQESLCH